MTETMNDVAIIYLVVVVIALIVGLVAGGLMMYREKRK